MKLSTVITTKNAEHTIKRALLSVAFSDEIIVVVDSETKDHTADIAKSHNAFVYIEPWHGYGSQKNYGMSKTKNEWILFIDADEEVTPRLAQEIQNVIQKTESDYYWIPVITVFLGKHLRHMIGYNPRLLKRSKGYWSDSLVHEQIITSDGTQVKLGDTISKKLSHPLIHYSHTTVSSYIQKMHIYTTLDAQQMAHDGKHRSGKNVIPSISLLLILALKQFTKLFFYKKGFLDGWQGWMWCFLSSYYEWEMGRKYLSNVKRKAKSAK